MKMCISAEIRQQKRFFIADYRKVDREEHHDEGNAHPPTARGHGKANTDQQRSKIKRIARVRIRARSRQRLILADVAGREGTNQ